jgi:hypothetical protein
MGLFNFLLGLTGVSEPKPSPYGVTDACGCPQCDPNTRVISECIRYPVSSPYGYPTAHFDPVANADTLTYPDGHTITVARPNRNGLSVTLAVSDAIRYAYNRGFAHASANRHPVADAKHHAKRLAKFKRHAERNADELALGDPWPTPRL